MYSQYMDGKLNPLANQSHPHSKEPEPLAKKAPQKNSNALLSDISQRFNGVLKQFSVDSLDTGDILLVLIILFLFLEGDNLELVITLGLMLLLGLRDDQSDT